MDQHSITYFPSINPLAKKIVEDCRKVELEYEAEWQQWDLSKREEVLDDILIHSLVKNKPWGRKQNGEDPYPESFPKLTVACGEKIIVDFENDCWTWQDEHSGPFSWKTKSQQDLSLADLEPSQLAANTKSLSEPSATTRNGGPRIRDGAGKVSVSKRIWESPFHVVERKGDSGYPSSQDSIQSSFDDIRQNLDLETAEETVTPSHLKVASEPVDKYNSSASKPAVLQISQKHQSSRSSQNRSPLKSPIISRLPLSPSFNKKTKDSLDETGVILLGNNKRDSVGQDNAAFDSQVDDTQRSEDRALTSGITLQDNGVKIEGEWSSFVGESSTDVVCNETSSPSDYLLSNQQTAPEQPTSGLQGTPNPVIEQMPSDNLLTNQDEVDQEDKPVTIKSGFDFLDNW